VLFAFQLGYGLFRQFAEPGSSGLSVADDGLPHAGFPEFPDMVSSTVDGSGSVGFCVEKVADVVGHFDQSFCFHGSLVIGGGMSRMAGLLFIIRVQNPCGVAVNQVAIIAGKAQQGEPCITRHAHGESGGG